MLPLLQICFCFVVRETLCCLCQTIIKLILLKLLTQPPDIWDDLLNIDNPFEQMVGQIYPTELQLNKANSSDTEAPFLDLNLSITNGIVSSKIYDKRDDFNFEIVNFPFLDRYVPRSPSYGVYISQLIRFARVCSKVDDFNNKNLFLTANLLKQSYRYHKRKAFSKFYHRHSELIVKYNIGLNTLLQQGISEPIVYGDLVYKFKRIVGKPNFSDQFKNLVKRYIRVGYNFCMPSFKPNHGL